MMDVLWSIFNRNFETTGSVIFYQQAWSRFSEGGGGGAVIMTLN